MDGFWQDLLYRPVLNFLILLYDTIAYRNLGFAVVWLTFFVRLGLLPLSIIVERNKSIYAALSKRIQKIYQDFEKDPVMMRESIRDLLRKNKVYPWANILLLGIQFLVLVLLYQVFIGGINLEPKVLYQFVVKPLTIDTTFIGLFDISRRNLTLSLIVAILLFVNIRLEQGTKKHLITRKTAFFLYIFPTFTFLILFWLPSVKALFILTSILLSYVIHFIQQPIYNFIYRAELSQMRNAQPKKAAEEKKRTVPTYAGDPWQQLRKKI